MIKIDNEKVEIEKGMPCGNVFCPANVTFSCGYNGGECPRHMKVII